MLWQVGLIIANIKLHFPAYCRALCFSCYSWTLEGTFAARGVLPPNWGHFLRERGHLSLTGEAMALSAYPLDRPLLNGRSKMWSKSVMGESRHLESESGSESRHLESKSIWIRIHPFFPFFSRIRIRILTFQLWIRIRIQPKKPWIRIRIQIWIRIRTSLV